MARKCSRRGFIRRAATVGGALGTGSLLLGEAPVVAQLAAAPPETQKSAPLRPIGRAKGIHPGRVVWVHDPQVLDWKGPGHGHWYEGNHTKQNRVDAMLSRAVGELTGESTVVKAWDKLFRHLNKTRGKGDVGYATGEKVVIKPNWVGMIWREGAVDPERYTLINRQDYMNTAPQAIIAVLRQLVEAGVREPDITVCDTLAYLVHEYYDILRAAFPRAQYVDFAGKFGRIKVEESVEPFYWSCRPEGVTPDRIPTCFAQAQYLVNLASLKAHTATGVTLCAKNHFGSLVRWPVQRGYYDMHRGCFQQKTGIYREQVDLLGHAHLGGKTVLNVIDGLLTGKHPADHVPRPFRLPPFDGQWPSSLLASQDPVAIDSVGFDFLWSEFDDFPRRPGADDYLHEAALADNPPSGTFYDPNHAAPRERLGSLGVHEHWNNAAERKYSRNLGVGEGIELIAASLDGAKA
jgi:hypothetical protein